jgi:hypothetical protein
MNPLSKRKLFNAILPEKKIVDHLDALHLGETIDKSNANKMRFTAVDAKMPSM